MHPLPSNTLLQTPFMFGSMLSRAAATQLLEVSFHREPSTLMFLCWSCNCSSSLTKPHLRSNPS